MTSFIWLTIFITGAASSIFGYWLLRHVYQRKRDMALQSFELTFPRDFSLEQAARMFTALSGIFVVPGKYGDPWGDPTIVFEVIATKDGLHHVLSAPPEVEESVRGHLLSVCPALGIEEVASQPIELTYGLRLMRNEANDVQPDPKLSTVLLSAMGGLQDDEIVLAQFVMRATGNAVAGVDGDPFYVSGRLGARGSDVRAKQLLTKLLVAYRSLQVFHFKPIHEVNGYWRRAPIAMWPASLTAEQLAVVTAIPVDAPHVAGLVLGRGRRFAPEPTIASVGHVLGVANAYGAQRPIALRTPDRYRHLLLNGPTGSGKSTVMVNSILQDIEEGHAVVVVESGDLVDDLLKRMSPASAKDVVLWDLGEKDSPVGFNPLSGSNPYATMGTVFGVMDKMWDLERTAPRAKNLLRLSLLSLAACPWP